jgi:hypothetical protein
VRYADIHECQVPIILMTHSAPSAQPKPNGRLNFTFVADDLKSGIEQATC